MSYLPLVKQFYQIQPPILILSTTAILNLSGSFSSQTQFSRNTKSLSLNLFFTEGQVDISWFHVAHFQEHGVVLEVPARVEQCYTVLENPSFSPIGVLLRIMSAVRHPIPINSVTLIYYHINVEVVTLHLYLIPNAGAIEKVTLSARVD